MATIKKFGFNEIYQKYGYNPASNEEILRRLQFIGREVCNHARRSGSYKDRTGNLRSSVGFAIVYNGKIVNKGGFHGKEEGIKAAQSALDRYVEESNVPMVGWAMVMVAGMSYATYVEAKGYNVLHETESQLKQEIEDLRKELNLK